LGQGKKKESDNAYSNQEEKNYTRRMVAEKKKKNPKMVSSTGKTSS